MGTNIKARETKQAFYCIALLITFLAAAYAFPDGLGLIVFLVLGIAALVQLFRVALLRGKSETLSKLWSAFKDAFWGSDELRIPVGVCLIQP